MKLIPAILVSMHLVFPTFADVGEPESQDESSVPTEVDDISAAILNFESPEEEIRYLVENYKNKHLNPFNRNPRLIEQRAREAHETYFPLMLQAWEEAETREDAEAHLAVLTGTFRGSHREDLREILLPMILGEDSRSFDPCADCVVEGEFFLPYLAMDLIKRMPELADSDEAWALLPLIGNENRRVANTARDTIVQIGDPSIIPALQDAVRSRVEKYPDDYRSNVQEKLPGYLVQLADQLRERHAAKAEIEDVQAEEKLPSTLGNEVPDTD